MVRLGVMSDMSIKSAFPEFQAPNVALASAMDMIILQKHELSGMRLPKDFIRKKISRFPINDIANYSSLSNVDNVSKTVYASTQGYRKKLGSSNIDREDRQSTGKFKLNERMMPTKYSENFELKRRGGYVDIIDAKSSISQEQLVVNLKQVNQENVKSINKQVRNSQIGLAKVESNMNSDVLNNLENAKANSLKQIEKIQKEQRFKNMYGGEVLYNELTIDQYHKRTNPNYLREGEIEKEIEMEMYVPLFGTIKTSEKIMTKEPYIFMKDKPKYNDTVKPRYATKEERDAYEATLPLDPDEKLPKKSIESSNEPSVKNLPRDKDNEIDLLGFIEKREQKKLENTKYVKRNETIQEELYKRSMTNKPIEDSIVVDRMTSAPTQFREKYRKDFIETTDLTKLGQQMIKVNQRITDEYETLFEHNVSLAMEEHLPPPHLIPVPEP